MTTIAWDGRYLAADTLMTFGNGSINQLPSRKLVVRAGHVFASTGRIINGLRDRMVDWWFATAVNGHGEPMPNHGAADAVTMGSLIIVTPDWRCGCVSYIGPDFLEAGPISAWGSGEDYAIGAIEAGANAMEAVLIAMKHDINTGGEVEFVDTYDLDRGVQRYTRPAGGMLHASGNGAATSIRAAGDPTLPDHVLISKPRAPKQSDTGANLWADACTGRLVLGTGCGACLRCNREWWALLRGSHESVSADVIRLSETDVKRSIERAPLPDRAPPLPDILDITVERYRTLNHHVDAWNTASAVGDAHRMRTLDIELRSLAFPPNVQVVIVGDDAPGSPKRKVIINAPAQPQA